MRQTTFISCATHPRQAKHCHLHDPLDVRLGTVASEYDVHTPLWLICSSGGFVVFFFFAPAAPFASICDPILFAMTVSRTASAGPVVECDVGPVTSKPVYYRASNSLRFPVTPAAAPVPFECERGHGVVLSTTPRSQWLHLEFPLKNPDSLRSPCFLRLPSPVFDSFQRSGFRTSVVVYPQA